MQPEQPWIFDNLSKALADPAACAPTAFSGDEIRPHIREERTGTLFDFYGWLPATSGAPARSLADAFSLRPWLGSIMILEPIEGGAYFRYRLYGSAIADVAGFDMTGKKVSDFGSRTGAFFMSVYRRCLATDAPCLTHNLGEHARRFVVWERLVLPFATDDGSRQLVVSNIPIAVAKPSAQG